MQLEKEGRTMEMCKIPKKTSSDSIFQFQESTGKMLREWEEPKRE